MNIDDNDERLSSASCCAVVGREGILLPRAAGKANTYDTGCRNRRHESTPLIFTAAGFRRRFFVPSTYVWNKNFGRWRLTCLKEAVPVPDLYNTRTRKLPAPDIWCRFMAAVSGACVTRISEPTDRVTTGRMIGSVVCHGIFAHIYGSSHGPSLTARAFVFFVKACPVSQASEHNIGHRRFTRCVCDINQLCIDFCALIHDLLFLPISTIESRVS